jgi:nucleoside-diphosphate-sugar epimerase
MDRVTASRNFRHVPNRIAHLATGGNKRVRVNTLDAVGDYIHAEDVARAIVALLQARHLRHNVYNIAYGTAVSIRELVAWAAEKVPGFGAEVVPPEEADVVQDPTLTDGMWGAYDISRIRSETGWQPRPLRAALHAYMDWIEAERNSSTPQGQL